eukprot:symbB.v1.2.011670.t1/scaffold785.1/size162803/7
MKIAILVLGNSTAALETGESMPKSVCDPLESEEFIHGSVEAKGLTNSRTPLMAPPVRAAYVTDAETAKLQLAPGRVIRATTSLAFGALALREEPLLRVPNDTSSFLRSDAPAIFCELSESLKDTQRLAAYAAFLALSSSQKELLLDLGLPNGSRVLEASQRAVNAFLRDCPEYAAALDWQQFTLVISIISERGTRLASGDHVLYSLSDAAKHSCKPNAVCETLTEDGLREVRILSFDGIAENEELTVSYFPEEVLLQNFQLRRKHIADLRQGYLCSCTRCKLEDDENESGVLTKICEKLRPDLPIEDLQRRLQLLHHLDLHKGVI